TRPPPRRPTFGGARRLVHVPATGSFGGPSWNHKGGRRALRRPTGGSRRPPPVVHRRVAYTGRGTPAGAGGGRGGARGAGGGGGAGWRGPGVARRARGGGARVRGGAGGAGRCGRGAGRCGRGAVRARVRVRGRRSPGPRSAGPGLTPSSPEGRVSRRDAPGPR